MNAAPFPQRDLDELLTLEPSPWEKLRRARVFLTGGSGLFGRWMLASLLHAVDALGLETRIVVLVRDPEAWRQAAPQAARHQALKIHQGDLLNFTSPKEVFTHVVHLAAPSDGPSQAAEPLALFDILVGGTRRVLEFAARAGAERFLYVSSGAVYGRHVKAIKAVPEDCREAPDQMDPASCYDEGKRAAELLCALYFKHKNLPAVVARCFSVLGPGLPLDWHFAAGNFLRDALQGGPIKVKGDGTPERSYLYLADLAWRLWTLLTDGRPGRAYNVGGDEAVNMAELARRVANLSSPPLPVEISRRPEPGRTPQRQVPDTRRIKEELGLYSRITLDEALRRSWEWHGGKENRNIGRDQL